MQACLKLCGVAVRFEVQILFAACSKSVYWSGMYIQLYVIQSELIWALPCLLLIERIILSINYKKVFAVKEITEYS